MAANAEARPTKQQLRLELLARRHERLQADRDQAADALCTRVIEIPEVAAATRVACYAAMPEEPGTLPLLAALSARGCDVLLPLLRPDFDLDWAPYDAGAMQAARFGIREPSGEPLGVAGVLGASVVICPALAADEHGHRLGRGGGSYDRVLSRLLPGVLRVALLYDDEVFEAVPNDEHDERVHRIVTPRRTLTGWSL